MSALQRFNEDNEYIVTTHYERSQPFSMRAFGLRQAMQCVDNIGKRTTDSELITLVEIGWNGHVIATFEQG